MKALIVIGREFINRPEVATAKELYDFLEGAPVDVVWPNRLPVVDDLHNGSLFHSNLNDWHFVVSSVEGGVAVLELFAIGNTQ